MYLLAHGAKRGDFMTKSCRTGIYKKCDGYLEKVACKIAVDGQQRVVMKSPPIHDYNLGYFKIRAAVDALKRTRKITTRILGEMEAAAAHFEEVTWPQISNE